MDFKVLKKLIGLVEKSAIDELEVEHGDMKVRIKKTGTASNHPAQVITAQAPSPALTAETLAAQAENVEELIIDEGVEEVVSPMVGTFYSAATPGETPFVQEGDEVKMGDTLCLVEAMKLMNEIESPHDGQIMSIMVDNAQPVEYGERLFLIKPY